MEDTLIQTYLALHQKAWGRISPKIGIYTVPRESPTYELSIVIGSYNTKDLLRECLQSVELEAAGLSTGKF
jgi:hypothetical protein